MKSRLTLFTRQTLRLSRKKNALKNLGYIHLPALGYNVYIPSINHVERKNRKTISSPKRRKTRRIPY